MVFERKQGGLGKFLHVRESLSFLFFAAQMLTGYLKRLLR